MSPNFFFWQFCWNFVKKEVMQIFWEFELTSFERSLNVNFIVLLPRKGSVEDLKDHRQISLVRGL